MNKLFTISLFVAAFAATFTGHAAKQSEIKQIIDRFHAPAYLPYHNVENDRAAKQLAKALKADGSCCPTLRADLVNFYSRSDSVFTTACICIWSSFICSRCCPSPVAECCTCMALSGCVCSICDIAAHASNPRCFARFAKFICGVSSDDARTERRRYEPYA